MSEEGGLEEFEESLRRGELFLQLLDGGLEGRELRAQGVNFGLQPLAIGTRRDCIGFHDGRVYAACASDSTL